MTAEIIYLIPDGCQDFESYVWCEDPAPGEDQKEEDAIKYLKASAVEKKLNTVVEAIKEAFGDQPLANDGKLLVSVDSYNRLAEKISAL